MSHVAGMKWERLAEEDGGGVALCDADGNVCSKIIKAEAPHPEIGQAIIDELVDRRQIPPE